METICDNYSEGNRETKKWKQKIGRLYIYVLRLPKAGENREHGRESIFENILELVKHINLNPGCT